MKKVTIYDIARELNVSTATINRALNNKPAVSAQTREKVLAKAEEMGYSPSKAAKSLARHTIRLDFIIYNRVPAFHNDIIAGVRQAFDELHDFNVVGEIHAFSGVEYTVHQQIRNKMLELYEKKHDGLLLLGTIDTNGIRDMIHLFHERGIRTAIINGDIPGSDRDFAIRRNATLAGHLAAELLYWFTGGGTVAIFSGRPDNMDHQESIFSFCQECDCRGMQVATVYENHDDEGFASYNTERLLREHPEVSGLYVNTANSISVCQKIKEMGLSGKIKLVTSDVFQEIQMYMQEGLVHATLFQNPYQQGYMAVDQMYRIISEGAVPDSTILVEPTVLLQSNLRDADKPIA